MLVPGTSYDAPELRGKNVSKGDAVVSFSTK